MRGRDSLVGSGGTVCSPGGMHGAWLISSAKATPVNELLHLKMYQHSLILKTLAGAYYSFIHISIVHSTDSFIY